MEDILFDSRSELDKLPFGAVTAGTSIRFGIRISEILGATNLKLMINKDGETQGIETELTQVWTERGYTRFEGSTIFESAGLYWYHFTATVGGEDRAIEKSGISAAWAAYAPKPWQLTVYLPDYNTPDWIMRGAFYHIFVDRFKKSCDHPLKDNAILRSDWGGIPNFMPDEKGEILNNDFFGGDLEGVIEKLPYLHALGINCIYLSPVFEAASNHKYDTSDYAKIDPAFGDDAVFARMCAEAGKLDIRVICDGVFNHTGSNSLYFNREGNFGERGAFRDQASPYYEWYSFMEWPDKYDAWWGIKTLPQIKKNSPSFRNFITGENGILEKWMSLGAYGWRLDVADELSEDFITELRRTVKRYNPDALIIGEVWEDASNKISYGNRRHYFQGEELDSVMNYPLKEAILGFMLTGRAEDIRDTVETLCENYPKPALDCLMNILGTHDTGRVLTVLSSKNFAMREERATARLSPEDRAKGKVLLRLASLLQFTLPGVPSIYYGDEAGLEGYEDPFNRRCYPWGDEDQELLDWYRTLLAARKACSAFAGGDYRTLRAENGIYIFERLRSSVKALVLVSLGNEAISVEVAETSKVLLQYNCEQNGNTLRVFREGCAIIQSEAEA